MTNPVKIYTDLDTILDTRLGTLRKHRPEALDALKDNGRYWQREYDDWAGFTGGLVNGLDFTRLYRERDVEVLKVSHITAILLYFKNIVSRHEGRFRTAEEPVKIELHVNAYPYELTEEELKAFSEAIGSHFFGHGLDVLVYSMPTSEITVPHIRDNFMQIVSYHGTQLILQNTDSLIKERLFGVDMTCPLLFVKDPSQLSKVDKAKQLAAAKLTMREFIALDYIHAYYFSEFDKNRKKASEPFKNPNKSFSMA